MLEALLQGLLAVLQVKAFSFMLLGILVGFWVGLLPGLGGATTLALMLPFIYNMQPVEAFAFLLGMHSVVATTGDITSVLFGVPGEATTAAIILDGYSMTKKGQAGRAPGAAPAGPPRRAVIAAGAPAVRPAYVPPPLPALAAPGPFVPSGAGLPL